MGYTDGACYGDKVGNMACFLRERRRGKIKESRGDPAVVSPKEERKREKWGGSGTGTRRESGADRMLEKGATHSTQRRRALHDAVATRKWGTTDPDRGGVCRARSEMTQHAKHGQLK